MPRRIPLCHPEHAHYAIGLCRRCYMQKYEVINRAQRTKYRKERYHRNIDKYREAHRNYWGRTKITQNQRRRFRRAAHLIKPDKPKSSAAIRSARLRQYGLTLQEYDAMLLMQNGECAICRRSGINLHVDHDHLNKKARALICSRCNTSVAFCEDTKWLSAAMKYLELQNKNLT